MECLGRFFNYCMLIVLFGIYGANIYAQETVTTSGGNATGIGGTVSYSVGQVAYTTNTSTFGTVTQGVQQSYAIEIVSGVEESSSISLDIAVFPNPTSDFLKLSIPVSPLENFSYQLFDNNGVLIQVEEISDKETIIQTGDLLPAAYYLKVIDPHKEIITFKIIKK